jgi:beta-N-acetylhexosaminidase
MGFQGLVISDDLRMNAIKQQYPLEQSVVQAVNAGVDILLVTDNLERRVMNALVGAVKEGKLKKSCIDQAYERIMATKKKYGILTAPVSRPQVETQGKGVPVLIRNRCPAPRSQAEAQGMGVPIIRKRHL